MDISHLVNKEVYQQAKIALANNDDEAIWLRLPRFESEALYTFLGSFTQNELIDKCGRKKAMKLVSILYSLY